MAISYCTLSQANTTAKIQNTTGEFETYYKSTYDRVTRRIDQITNGNTFAPRIETRKYDGLIPALKSGVLYTNYPILSLTSVTINGTAATLSDFEIFTYDGKPGTEIYSDSGWSFTDTRRNAIAIAGVWGYRTYYSEDGWNDETTLSANINASVTSVTVADATNIDAGDMIQVNSEWMSVTSKSINTLTVKRGIRGSTAASHTSGDTVSRWIPEPDIADAAALMMSYAYQRRGNFQQVEFDQTGVSVTFPPDQPLTVLNILKKYTLGYTVLV